MRRIDIGQTARSGEYCDICKKTIYIDIWGHIERHKRELQRREDERAGRDASDEFMERLQNRASFAAYKEGRYRPVGEFMDEMDQLG